MTNEATIDQKLEHLPKTPGCYLFKNENGQILYVGKAKNLRSRVRQYFQDSKRDDLKLQMMVSKIRDLEVIETDSEVEALILESNLVHLHRPRYNIELKDDKSYPYIKITEELFPRIYVTREKERSGGKFFGPYTDVKNLRQTLKTLHRIFPIRSCTHPFTQDIIQSKKVKLCLDYYIHKCDGPCQGLIESAEYQRTVEQMKRFLSGKTRDLLIQLREEMQAFAKAMQFEEAAKIRDRIRDIENYTSSQKIVFQDLSDKDITAIAAESDDACGVIFKVRDGKMIGRQHFYFSRVADKTPDEVLEKLITTYYKQVDFIPQEIYLPFEPVGFDTIKRWLAKHALENVDLVIPKIGEKQKLVEMATRNAGFLLGELKLQKLKAKQEFVPRVMLSLQRDLNLRRVPRRIECFDNSNLQGADPVASMVVFVDGKPRKSDYRKFRIRTVQGADDFASMHEVVTRRYLRVLEEGIDFPDLIVVDGGKGQLSAAIEALEGLGIKISKAGSEGQPLVALAKRLEEVFIPDVNDSIMIPKTSSSIKLLQQVRDEAHRFAITFHRHVRDQRTLLSELEEIDGVGEKRRNRLLSHFGSVKNLSQASVEDLLQVDGISESLAAKISRYFQGPEIDED